MSNPAPISTQIDCCPGQFPAYQTLLNPNVVVSAGANQQIICIPPSDATFDIALVTTQFSSGDWIPDMNVPNDFSFTDIGSFDGSTGDFFAKGIFENTGSVTTSGETSSVGVYTITAHGAITVTLAGHFGGADAQNVTGAGAAVVQINVDDGDETMTGSAEFNETNALTPSPYAADGSVDPVFMNDGDVLTITVNTFVSLTPLNAPSDFIESHFTFTTFTVEPT